MSSPSTVLITGANTGIGLEVVKSLASSSTPYKIILAGRTPSKITSAISEVQALSPDTQSTFHSLTIDVESDDSISSAVKEVEEKFGTIDILINNAGASFEQGVGKEGCVKDEREAFRKDWDVNVAGAHITTRSFLPSLLKETGHKKYVLFITSGTCSLVESESEVMYFNRSHPGGLPKPIGITAYRSCKTGLNMVMRDWDRMLKNDGVFVACVSPGFLATGLGGVGPEALKKLGAGDPKLGGDLIVDVVEGRRADGRGKVVKRGGIQPW